jgi:hypothetical protein
MAKKPSFRDLFKKRATRGQIKLIKEPRTALRPVAKAEKLANPDKFSPNGNYLVRKSVKKVGARTVFVRKSDKQDWRINIHHGRAAKLRLVDMARVPKKEASRKALSRGACGALLPISGRPKSP